LTAIFNQIDTPYTPKTEGGIGGITRPHNLEQFYISRCKTLAKIVDENLKFFLEFYKIHYLLMVKFIFVASLRNLTHF